MYDPPGYVWAITARRRHRGPGRDLLLALRRRGAGRPEPRRAPRCWPAARPSCSAAGRRQRRDRRSRLVPHPTRPRGAVAAGRGVRLSRPLLALRRIPVVARALTAPGMVNRLESAAHVPGDRGGLPDHDGPRPPARAVRAAGRPGRHGHRPRRAAARCAGPRRRPPRRPVAQRLRPGRSGRGPDPRRPHRLPADQRHPGAARRSARCRWRWSRRPKCRCCWRCTSRRCRRWRGHRERRCGPPPRSPSVSRTDRDDHGVRRRRHQLGRRVFAARRPGRLRRLRSRTGAPRLRSTDPPSARLRRASLLGGAPAGDQVVGVDQPDVDGRADGDAPPLDDAPVDVRRRPRGPPASERNSPTSSVSARSPAAACSGVGRNSSGCTPSRRA